MFRLALTYLAKRKVFAFAVGYVILSAILKASTGVDICIPCLWDTIFGFHCPGCGLTTALISLLKCDLNTAYE